MARSIHSQAIVPARRPKGRSLGQKDTKPRKRRARPGGKAVLGKPGVELVAFGIVVAGTEVNVAVWYTPPRTIAGNHWPLATEKIEVSNMAACLNDLDDTVMRIVRQFNASGTHTIQRQEVKGWFQAQTRQEAPRPVVVPQVPTSRERACPRCKRLMPSAYPGDDPSCLMCGYVEYVKWTS